MPARQGGWPLLLGFARRRRVLLGGVACVIIGGALCAVGSQYAVKLLIDSMAAPGPAHPRLYRDLALLMMLLGAEGLFWRLGGWLGSKAVIAMGAQLRADLFRRVLAQPWRFFHDHQSGALAARIRDAAGAATQALGTMIWNVVPPTADLLGSVAVLALIQWQFACLLVVGVGGLTWFLHTRGGRGFPLHQAYYEETARVAGEVGDVLAHVTLVKSFGRAEAERTRLDGRLAREGRLHAGSWMFLERLRLMHDVAFWAMAAVILFAAVQRWNTGRLSTGDVVVVIAMSLRILNGSRELALAALGLSRQIGALHEAAGVLEAAGETMSLPAPALPQQAAPDLVFDRVWFAPDGQVALFRDVSLTIPAGQHVGLVGRSGAGKSTLLRLLLGLSLPDRGSISCGAQRLADLGEEARAALCAVVTQEVELLHRSVAENLRYGREDASPAEIDAAMDAAGFTAVLEGLRDGGEALLGDRGVMLSGGQRQRLALARGLLTRAPILLLDEATSALDAAAEDAVLRAVRRLCRGRTLVTVTHRVDTVMSFDRVIVLETGGVVQDGPPADLLRRGGPFASLWRLDRQEALIPEDA